MGAPSTAFLVFGMALLFAASNTTSFSVLSAAAATLANDRLLWLGLVLVLVGLAFKIAAFPMQMWAPDVYQGAPTPVTAYLGFASKAAGFVLLLRVLFVAAPFVARQWETFFMVAAGTTILYGNLCAIPQRSLKRLLGYSSIAHAGYLLLGHRGALNSRRLPPAILYYLAGYLFTLGAAFVVISLVARPSGDISSLAGLSKRSPILAAAMAMAMVSLAGIPPLAGFAGKFLLLQGGGGTRHGQPGLAIISRWRWRCGHRHFAVLLFWDHPGDLLERRSRRPFPIVDSRRMKISSAVCMVGMIYLGLFPNAAVTAAEQAVKDAQIFKEPAKRKSKRA